MSRKYETIFIVKPELPEEDLKAVTEKVQGVIESQNGELKRLEDWGVRKLAYLIQKLARGRYYYARFDGDNTLVAELERRLRLDDRVIRYQTVKIEKEVEAPVAAAAPATETAAEAPAAEEAAAE